MYFDENAPITNYLDTPGYIIRAKEQITLHNELNFGKFSSENVQLNVDDLVLCFTINYPLYDKYKLLIDYIPVICINKLEVNKETNVFDWEKSKKNRTIFIRSEKNIRNKLSTLFSYILYDKSQDDTDVVGYTEPIKTMIDYTTFMGKLEYSIGCEYNFIDTL